VGLVEGAENMSKKCEELTIDGPKLDPTCELFLRGDNERITTSAMFTNWLLFACPAVTLSTTLGSNFIAGVPLRARMHVHAFSLAVGVALGIYSQKMKDRWTAEKDVLYYHYMTLHPEDFQPPERVLYRDYLTRWTPIR